MFLQCVSTLELTELPDLAPPLRLSLHSDESDEISPLQTTLDILDGLMHKLLGGPQQNVEGAARYEWLCRRACLAAVPLGGHVPPESPSE